MIAYQGKEPFAFFSYSHADANEVTSIIKAMKGRMCRIWYDEGLTPGESWNDEIAERILQCSQFVIFITPTAVKSRYVMSELNFALSKEKNILPVLLAETTLPVGIDLMLSTYQRLDIAKFDLKKQDDFTTACDKITDNLGRAVFSTRKDPFLEESGYYFYLRTQEVERRDSNKIEACQIVCRDGDGKESVLVGLHRLGAYEVAFSVSAVERITDFFFQGKINGLYQVNLLGRYLLEYPLYGPDVDVIIICILRIPRHGEPTMKIVDYQYVDSVSSTNLPEYNDLDNVGESGWSTQIKKYYEGKLN